MRYNLSHDSSSSLRNDSVYDQLTEVGCTTVLSMLCSGTSCRCYIYIYCEIRPYSWSRKGVRHQFSTLCNACTGKVCHSPALHPVHVALVAAEAHKRESTPDGPHILWESLSSHPNIDITKRLCLGLEMSGALGVWLQFGFCLLSTVPVLPIAAGLSRTVSTRLIAVGLVFSRMGLWLFDLSVSQMLQEQIDNSALGKLS